MMEHNENERINRSCAASLIRNLVSHFPIDYKGSN